MTTIAGPSSQLNNGMSDCGYTDGSGNNVRFSWSTSVDVSLAIDGNDNIYIGERGYNRIRKITLTENAISLSVTLTHNASPTTTVSNGDTVTVTATFSEAMQATPTISIDNAAINSQVSDAAMSATSSTALWTYNWTVSSTVSTEVGVTVSGTDLAGHLPS